MTGTDTAVGTCTRTHTRTMGNERKVGETGETSDQDRGASDTV